jgi:hypothetical protein
MKLKQPHLWAGLLVGVVLQVASASCWPVDDCPDDEPYYDQFPDGSYVPSNVGEYCELDAVITLENDVVHIDYVAEDGHEYRVIYDVVDREWDQGG